MAQRVVVKSIVTKPTKKEGTNITTIEDEKGAKMSAFNDTELAKVHAGDVLEVEISIDGKYTNITGWKLIESKPQAVQPPAPPQRQESFKADPEKIASQERMTLLEVNSKARNTALMQACPFSKNPDEVLVIADKFLAWLKGESKPAIKVPEKPKDLHQAIKEATGKESITPAQQQPALPVLESQEDAVTRPVGMPQSIKTGAQLAQYANKRETDTASFIAIVQGTPNDLKTEEQLIAAWNVLVPQMKVK